MPDLVRVRDSKSNTEYTVGRRRAEQLAERGDVEIVKDGRATDRLGRALDADEATTKTAKSKEQAR